MPSLAYVYPDRDHPGHEIIRFNGGEEVNGVRPIAEVQVNASRFEIDALLAENAALRYRLKYSVDGLSREVVALREENARLRTELERAGLRDRKDAVPGIGGVSTGRTRHRRIAARLNHRDGG
jgi:hypothetical protein